MTINMLTAENQMKKDITNRADVEFLIDSFYNTVQKDATIGYFFNDIAQIDWNTHLPQMYNFWESIIFAKKVYTGNPMRKHLELAKKSPLKSEHFEHWIKLFYQTIDSLFSGVNAERTKTYAQTIRENLELRTSNSDNMLVF